MLDQAPPPDRLPVLAGAARTRGPSAADFLPGSPARRRGGNASCSTRTNIASSREARCFAGPERCALRPIRAAICPGRPASRAPQSRNEGKGADRNVMEYGERILGPDDPILITGATGFIGSRVVKMLLDRGFRNLRCFARPSSDVARLDAMRRPQWGDACEVINGNLLSREDCAAATKDVAVIFHLAAARGEKSFPDAFMNSVRHDAQSARREPEARLLAAIRQHQLVLRSTPIPGSPTRRLLDESCPVEQRPELRGDAYCFAKVKQDEIVAGVRREVRSPVRHRQARLRLWPRQRGDHGPRRHRHVRRLPAPGRRQHHPVDVRRQLRRRHRAGRRRRRASMARSSTSSTTICRRAGRFCVCTSGTCGRSGRSTCRTR